MIGNLSPVQAIRRFNRFYTHKIGVLNEAHLGSPFSLAEVRVLYELAHRTEATATDLCRALGLDPGYLSRMLAKFKKQGLISRKRSESDARQSHILLTEKGRRAFAPLDAKANEQISAMLNKLSPAQQDDLLHSMHSVSRLLEPETAPKIPYVLRPPRPGDIGWVVHRHGDLYWREYGYDEHFEALVARIMADFVEQLDPKRERCWIAEREGENVGCIFLVKHSKTIAKLRVLLVEPAARGLGIGKRLVGECVRFAREVGYKKIVLWTQSELAAARHLYQGAGFKLAGKKRHSSWGRDDLIAETWELKL